MCDAATFNLSMSVKNFWVQLYGGPPWGFRMREEKGNYALVISRVNSKGRQQGLKEGDRVLSVNGRSTAEMTHDDAQRVIRESTSGVELHLERSSGSPEINGFKADQNGNMSTERVIELQLNSLEEDANHAGSWSTDSTSTGSTTIHVSSLNSDDTSASDNVWSPSSKKRTNLHLNLHNTTSEPVQTSQTQSVTNSMTNTSTRTVKVSSSSSSVKEVTIDEGEEKSPVWQPFGAPYSPQFRPVKLEVGGTKGTTTATSTPQQNELSKKEETNCTKIAKPESPKPSPKTPKESIESSTPATSEKTLETDNKAEEILAQNSSTTFTKTGWSSHLPPSQSPTITLLQKAREGQIPKGAVYIEEKSDSTPIPRNAVLIDQKVTVEGDKIHTDSYYAVPTLTTETTTHNVKAPPKYDGIGPTEYGIPVGLRTGVKEEYASDWYKTMYKSLHRNKFPNDTNQTVHLGGYMSEPEFERKDKLLAKYATEHRRKPEKTVSYSKQEASNHQSLDKSRITADSSVVRHEPRREAYRVEPRSIADYEPGRSSLAEKEFEKHEHLGPVSPRPSQQGLNRRWANVLLSDGYESDSTLIRKTGRNPEVDPDQQKAWYKEIQKGGEIPMTGLRKSAPEKPTASPHQYQETQVNIHYKSPIRHLEKEYIEEEELRKRQEDAMRKLYEEERRKKHQQEMAEIEMRRHSDFFTPSQKSPIPLNRYDNPFQTSYSNKLAPPGFSRGPAPKTMARTLYPFSSQTPRELSLNKGDIVYINKQIDKNWYEGEHHGLVGIFPVSYVEIIPSEKANLQPRKPIEGEALVKYNFPAQSPMELSLFKGEKVILLRKLDHNWYEGRLGTKKGIFPVSYVQVLREPREQSTTEGNRAISPKPPASPIFGSSISESPLKAHEGPMYNTSIRPLQNKPPLQSETKSLTQSLHIDTYNEPIPYRSLYSYKPQNEDELELKEGDTVYVMEKCDDGWYVGTSLRTGLFGTFPGNYVERI